MRKFLFTTLAVGALAVSAGAAEVVIPKNSDGCFEISTKEQLLGFAQHVNVEGHKDDCALLMNDIKFNGDKKVVNDGMTAANLGSFDSWTPFQEFAGTFDGQGHTIFGLYYVAPETTENGTKGYRDAGFFAHLSGHAKVVNVRIEDSFFAADERAGGIAADIKAESEVYIDQVSFSGVVSAKTSCKASDVSYGGLFQSTKNILNGYIGGLIGTVSKGAKIINLSNSYNEGTVTTNGCGVWDKDNPKAGGLIGVVQDLADVDSSGVNISNCYNAGTVTYTNSSKKSAEGPSILGKLEGDNSAATAAKITTENVGCTKAQSTYCVSSSTSAALKDAYEENIDNQIADILNPEGEGAVVAKGVSINRVDGKIVATIHENDGTVVIPQDILVDSVVYTRSFTADTRSTITLPFSISAANVVGADGQPVVLRKLETMIVDDDNKWEIDAKILATGAVEAHTPYVVEASATGSLSFKGRVTLKQTNGTANSVDVPYESSNWLFNGVYTTKTWENDLANCPECGRAYVFKDGAFKKVGSKVRASVYRAYLLAPEEYKVVVAAKAAAGVSLSKENPDEITIRDIGTDENDYQKYEVTFKVVEVVESIDTENDETLSISKPMMGKEAVKSDRWFDLKGRRLNSKPTAHGTYFNNKTPVVVK